MRMNTKCVQIQCPVCGKKRKAQIREDRIRTYLSSDINKMCTDCRLSKYYEKVVIECGNCGKEIETFKLNNGKYYKNYCDDCAIEIRTTKVKTFNQIQIQISPTTMNIIEQEILTNGEELFLKMLDLGRRQLFGKELPSRNEYVVHV